MGSGDYPIYSTDGTCTFRRTSVIQYNILHFKYRIALLMHKVSLGEYKQEGEDWESLNENARDLIRGLMCVNVDQRLGAKEALQHKWF